MKKLFRNKQIKDSLAYLSGSKNYILIVIGIFVFGTIVGFIFSDRFSFIAQILSELVSKVEGKNFLELSLFILGNNLMSAFVGLAFGVFLGLFPIWIALSNGVILGYVFNRVCENGSVLDLWRILPHGIFELPAIFIALGLGLRLGMFFTAKNKMEELGKRISYSVTNFVIVVIPLLIIAAVIEGLLITLGK